MAGNNRKSISNFRRKSKSKNRNNTSNETLGGKKSRKSTGPRLPAALRKQLDTIRNPNLDNSDDEFVNNINGSLNDEEIDSDEGEVKNDLYEYEEEVAEEESIKNRRYDPVENFEYQLPEKFEDEDVLSDDDVIGDGDNEDFGEDDDEHSDDDGRHARLLHNITGIPTEAFEDIGKKRKRNKVVSEVYPESEFNPSRDVLNGDGQIDIDDLLAPISGSIRKKIKRLDEKAVTIRAPLPKPVQEKVERGAAYDIHKKEITKWEHLIKRNREAPTLYFDKVNDIGFPTVGAIASEFTPRTEFEKSISSLLHDDEVMDAYKNDGTKILEMNKIPIEDVKERQDRLAKMRSLLFRHEMKAKHVKKIKSKTYHRLKKKDKLKVASLDTQTDPEAARELAEKQEWKRAEARLTLRKKNQNKWAKRILRRGMDKQDDSTRAALADQLHQHNLLTRKMNTMKDNSSSEGSSDEDDEDVDSSDEDGASKLLAKAKEKTIKLMEEEEEQPDSSVFSLSFMARGLEKRKEAANEEARRALEEYELSLNQQDRNAAKVSKHMALSGRRVIGVTQTEVQVPKMKHRPEVDNYGSDNEDIIVENDDIEEGLTKDNFSKGTDVSLDVLREDLEIEHNPVLKLDDVFVEGPGPRTSYDVSAFTSGSFKKVKSSKGNTSSTFDGKAKHVPEVAEPSSYNAVSEEEESDSDDGGQMIDGMLSSGAKQTYELPSNEDLMKRAFGGDEVEEEFQKAKEDVLNEENPEPEKPLKLPGWGEWTDVQKKRGLPIWMQKEHADAKRKREAALKKRKDAHLKHVIISEKVDKKAEKLYSKTLPYPFTSKEVFEQSIRMPIGPEYNPVTAAPALIRPSVVKKSGLIIEPIAFEEVDPHERVEDHKQGGQRRKAKNKSSVKKPFNSKILRLL